MIDYVLVPVKIFVIFIASVDYAISESICIEVNAAISINVFI
jgi:hypothetical protein